MPPHHRFRVVPLWQFVVQFEVVNDLRAVRAAQVHEEVVAAIYHVDHKGLHFLIVNLIRCVHVFQFRTVPKKVPRHQLGKAFPNDLVVLQFC
jgi:hypothetical protein